MLVFGTRPEAIKMCPLVIELKKVQTFEVVVCVTGQHREMLRQVLECFDVRPDYDLDIMKDQQTLFDITAAVLCRMKDVLEQEMPSVLLVHGDTSTAFASALAAFYLKIPVGHVEAGLRTYNLAAPYPEEFNRQAVSLISGMNFAPTQAARQNLLNEGFAPESVYVTGNTGIDALRYTVQENYSHPVLEWAKGGRLVLLTAHRRENCGKPFQNIFSAIRRLAADLPDIRVVYPLHMNPAIRKMAHDMLDGCDNICLTEPMDVIDFHNIMARSELILTDSGGIQEEAPALGKPVLVLRNTTERPEGVEAGTLRLVGTEEEKIYREAYRLLTDPEEYQIMRQKSNPYGDGTASIKIAHILEEMNTVTYEHQRTGTAENGRFADGETERKVIQI